jgi:mannose-6-phosphate isomerase-like protein (cupin superfamily)
MAKVKAKPKSRAKARVKSTARRATPARRAVRAKPKRKALPKQQFIVSHHREEDFEEGLRSYAKYRDLGVAKATHGMVQAHVIRMVPPCDPAVVSKRHYHDVDFQMIYVLKGWMKGEYDGREVTVRAGSCWIQPPRIKHTVLDYSDDCELLEIILPAEFETVEL